MSRTLSRLGAPLVGAALILSGCSPTGGAGTPTPEGPITPGTSIPSTVETPPSSQPVTPEATGSTPTDEASSAVTQPGEDADLAGLTLFKPPATALARAAEISGGIVHELELGHSRDHGGWVYEVYVRDGDIEHEITIDAVTGKVLEVDRDDDEDDPVQAIDLSIMSPSEAMRIALQTQPGTVSEWKLAWRHGRLVYEVDVRTGDDSVDVFVDVESGEASLDR